MGGRLRDAAGGSAVRESGIVHGTTACSNMPTVRSGQLLTRNLQA